MTVTATNFSLRTASAACVILAGVTLSLFGCKTEETRTGGTILLPPPGSPPPAFGSASQTSVSAIGVCSVPYDGFTLPLISPDGRWLATQTGVAPTWPTLLATKGQTVPLASSIEIWELDARAGQRVITSAPGLILGRSADHDGFLVEEVLDDGSRRIGRVAWPVGPAPSSLTGEKRKAIEPEWIVDDGRVNAHACLSPDGALAWCSRDIEGEGFALSVEHSEGSSDALRSTHWDLPAEPEQSWMLPVFSKGSDRDGRMLFAISLRDGVADLVAGEPSSSIAFQQSMVKRRLSNRMDARRTYQTLAPQGTEAAVDPTGLPRLLLFDPDLRRMAMWDAADDTFRPLAEGSFAACVWPPIDQMRLGGRSDGAILVADADGLILDHPAAAPGYPPRVYPRSAVPRRVEFLGDAPHDWVLFVPDRKTISVVRFALLEASLTGR